MKSGLNSSGSSKSSDDTSFFGRSMLFGIIRNCRPGERRRQRQRKKPISLTLRRYITFRIGVFVSRLVQARKVLVEGTEAARACSLSSSVAPKTQSPKPAPYQKVLCLLAECFPAFTARLSLSLSLFLFLSLKLRITIRKRSVGRVDMTTKVKTVVT